uniref:Reverse transcriptase domain-containing protein n=1 Tax=Cyprinus carpio TaxID=7962 RepID=A0A8C1LN31_CYPCA
MYWNKVRLINALEVSFSALSYIVERSIFKKLCDRKKKQYNYNTLGNMLQGDMKTQQLWKKIKSFRGASKQSNNIEHFKWLEYFMQLLSESKCNLDVDFEIFVTDCVNNHDTTVFNRDEILDTLHMLCPIMLSLYNKILETGDFPESWCEAVICPLYKNSDKNDVENYRGISLLKVLGKIFTKILNTRLVHYAEMNNILFEEQAGYRSGYSTIDNIFILQSMVQKYITKQKGKMYCIFIDFSKAFDSVQHTLLYFILIKNGIGGKVFNVLKSMYSKLKSCVKGNEGLTEYFDCTIGVRQGCTVSPFLFVLFLNEYITMLKKNCKGIQIEMMTEVQTLLYADDMDVIISAVINVTLQRHVKNKSRLFKSIAKLIKESFSIAINQVKTFSSL